MIEQLGVATVDVPDHRRRSTPTSRQFPDAAQLRLANKCARERMTVLYDQSAAFDALVVGTSNKSELLLGYGTQFGDMASAINPIGDLYKTQLYQLAAYLGVPETILRKGPHRRPVDRPDRRRRAGLHLRRGRSADGPAGRSPLAAGGTARGRLRRRVRRSRGRRWSAATITSAACR